MSTKKSREAPVNWKADFITALSEDPCLLTAGHRVGVKRPIYWAERRNNPAFRKACDEAQEAARKKAWERFEEWLREWPAFIKAHPNPEKPLTHRQQCDNLWDELMAGEPKV